MWHLPRPAGPTACPLDPVPPLTRRTQCSAPCWTLGLRGTRCAICCVCDEHQKPAQRSGPVFPTALTTATAPNVAPRDSVTCACLAPRPASPSLPAPGSRSALRPCVRLPRPHTQAGACGALLPGSGSLHSRGVLGLLWVAASGRVSVCEAEWCCTVCIARAHAWCVCTVHTRSAVSPCCGL